ncbi:MAG: hypothetical protein GX946_03090, partial [Oligosphaeraceae bacterium]|nr:hypothetical protein [Oligosphaeraceae bacterium]
PRTPRKGDKKKLGGLGGEIKNRKWPFGKNGFVKREIEPIMPFFTAYGMTVFQALFYPRRLRE